MPTDPRTTIGVCASYGVSGPVFDGEFQPWQTGGVGAGVIAATAGFEWPPAVISGAGGVAVAQLPIYTPTATPITLPPPTSTPTGTRSIDYGNGWYNPADTALSPTEIAGCTYPDGWDAINAAIPPGCSGDLLGPALAARTPEPLVR